MLLTPEWTATNNTLEYAAKVELGFFLAET